jgi:cupin fold WbuC family metalloprotein
LIAGGDALGVDIPFGTYHAVLALAPRTVFLETKAGPYSPLLPAETAPWAPGAADAAAPAYLARLQALF